MSDYISDPALLQQLNTDEYVSDPALLEKLNAEESELSMPTEVDALGNMTQQALTGQAVRMAPDAVQIAGKVAASLPGNMLSEVASLGQVASKAGWEGAKTLGQQLAKTPLQTSVDLAKAYAQGHATVGNMLQPFVGQTAGQVAGTAARGLAGLAGQTLAAPESAFMYPYNMAAYEQEKIRANPTAPGLEYNPYAQTVRGEAATQGRAGAANQMRTVANQPYGNVSAQERAILEEDRMMRQNIRKKAYEKVMGPVAPGSF